MEVGIKATTAHVSRQFDCYTDSPWSWSALSAQAMSQLMGHTERRISQRIEGATRCHRSPQPKELLICRSRETYHNVSKVFVEWPWPWVVRWPLVATFSRSCKLNCTDHFGHVNPTICRPCSRLSLCSSVKTKPDKLHLLSNAFLMIKFDFAGVRVWSLDTETYSCSFFSLFLFRFDFNIFNEACSL